LNIYDTKNLNCTKCGRPIGEVEFDAKIVYSLCGNCVRPLSKCFVIPKNKTEKNSLVFAE